MNSPTPASNRRSWAIAACAAIVIALIVTACGGATDEFAIDPQDVPVTATVGRKDYQNPTPGPIPTTAATPTPVRTPNPTPTPTSPPVPTYFATRAPGASLPSDAECAAQVRAQPIPESHSENTTANSTAGGPSVLIDGAHGFRNNALADRITGNFTGTTEEILRWASCKWGIDEDLTRARAWTESSWSIETMGDYTTSGQVCSLIGLSAPCHQSHGLLQVKGTVHEGTYPHSSNSTAWGVDYAMAWQRACYEGAFTWLDDEGYTAGDMTGCVGAWYSGNWYDSSAMGYLEDVQDRADERPWD